MKADVAERGGFVNLSNTNPPAPRPLHNNKKNDGDEPRSNWTWPVWLLDQAAVFHVIEIR